MPSFLSSFFDAGPAIVFWVLALTAVTAAVWVVAAKSPIHSALFLLLTFLAVAGIFILTGAEFVGAVQILVYAGGIMVLFLFVIMLVNIEETAKLSAFHKETRWAGVLAALLLIAVAYGLASGSKMLHGPSDPKSLQTIPAEMGSIAGKMAGTSPGNSQAVGMVLYGRYLVPFEVASILLLVAMIGAIVMGKKKLESEEVDR